jgi:hypothetical protein
MWANYGALYQGAIIEYDANELIESARSHLLDLKRKRMFSISDEVLRRGPMLERVNYSKYRSDISSDLLKAHNLILKYGAPQDFTIRNMIRLSSMMRISKNIKEHCFIQKQLIGHMKRSGD